MGTHVQCDNLGQLVGFLDFPPEHGGNSVRTLAASLFFWSKNYNRCLRLLFVSSPLSETLRLQMTSLSCSVL